MSGLSRRFELLLPQRFNDGTPVPEQFVADALLELRQHFGAVSWETQIIRGLWKYEQQEFQDDLVRVFVDVPDEPESREFMIAFKERMKARFRQIDIWMTTYPIEIL